MAQPLTMPHAMVIGFTGWLIERGHEPHTALAIALGALAGTVTVTRVSWQGALAVVRRITANS